MEMELNVDLNNDYSELNNHGLEWSLEFAKQSLVECFYFNKLRCL